MRFERHGSFPHSHVLTSRQGRSENSPAIYGWEQIGKKDMSPVGTAEQTRASLSAVPTGLMFYS
jgi:hypothetical protein